MVGPSREESGRVACGNQARLVWLCAVLLMVGGCSGCPAASSSGDDSTRQSEEQSAEQAEQPGASAVDGGSESSNGESGEHGTKSDSDDAVCGFGAESAGKGSGNGAGQAAGDATSGSSSGSSSGSKGAGSSGTGASGPGTSSAARGRGSDGSSVKSGGNAAASEEPATAEEAARLARKALEQSESHEGDLALAYRHAALALQAAEAFPGNDACLALADAARGRLRTLERQAVSPVELQQSGDVSGKPIVESP